MSQPETREKEKRKSDKNISNIVFDNTNIRFITFFFFSCHNSSSSVLVTTPALYSTSALHKEGPGFEPKRNHKLISASCGSLSRLQKLKL